MTRADASSFALCLAVCALLARDVTGAQAQDDSTVRVRVAECTGQTVVDVDEALAIAKSELSPRALELVPLELNAGADDVLRLEICRTVRLRWRDAAGQLRLRELALAELPGPTRARTLALAFSELASELPGGAASAAPTKAARADAPSAGTSAQRSAPAAPRVEDDELLLDDALLPTSAERAPSPSPGPAVRLVLAAELRVIGPPSTALYGSRVTVLFDRFLFSANALFSQHTTALGSVRLGEGLAGFGYEAWTPHPALALLTLGELGATWVSAEATPEGIADAGVRFAAAALVGARARIAVDGSAWSATAVLLGGYAVGMRARSSGNTAASTHGACVSLALGVGLRL